MQPVWFASTDWCKVRYYHHVHGFGTLQCRSRFLSDDLILFLLAVGNSLHRLCRMKSRRRCAIRISFLQAHLMPAHHRPTPAHRHASLQLTRIGPQQFVTPRGNLRRRRARPAAIHRLYRIDQPRLRRRPPRICGRCGHNRQDKPQWEPYMTFHFILQVSMTCTRAKPQSSKTTQAVIAASLDRHACHLQRLNLRK